MIQLDKHNILFWSILERIYAKFTFESIPISQDNISQMTYHIILSQFNIQKFKDLFHIQIRDYNKNKQLQPQPIMKPRPQSAGYQAAGTFAKKIQPYQLAKQDKCALGVIHPISATKSRQKKQKYHDQTLQVVANKAQMKPVFKDRDFEKPVISDELVKPFLYVQQVVPKRKTQKTILAHPDVWQPVNTENSTRKPKSLAGQKEAAAKKQKQDLEDHRNQSLYDIQTHKRNVAQKLFEILYGVAPFEVMKKSFLRWARDRRLRVDRSNIAVDLSNFKKFMQQYSEGKVSAELATQFFNCFKRQTVQNLYIKALSYNFQAYRRSKMEVSNILSDKAAKTRFLWLRDYIDNWNNVFPELNSAIKQMAAYENSLRKYFLEIKNSYQNPHLQEIQYLQKQLEEPMVKYDAVKKKQINKTIETYNKEHDDKKQRLQIEYEEFVAIFQDLIVENHNMFFRKKTIMDLLTLISNQTPSITKEAIESMIGRQQESCQHFLQILNDVVSGFSNQKAKLKQDSFTLIQLANYVHRNHKTQFEIGSVKQLVRLVKQQYCLKYDKYLDNIEEFPGDEEIELKLLITCFEIQCTKILFKNDVWNEILQQIQIPESAYSSKFHSETINKNVTFQSLRRLLQDIDKNLTLQLNKSKQLSKFVSNVDFDHFKQFADILQNVDITQALPPTKESRVFALAPTEEKKIKFADMLFTNMSSLREAVGESDRKQKQEIERRKDPAYRAQKEAQEQQIRKHQQIKNKAESISKEVKQKSKATFQQSVLFQSNNFSTFGKLQQERMQPHIGMKTMAKSFITPEPININALDARYHDQTFSRVEQKKMSVSKLQYKPTAEQDIHIIGTSVLLSNLPKINELPQDPLKVSKYLMNTLQKVNQEVEHVINSQKKNPKNIKEGVESNYYKEKVDLQRRPYKIDCEGTTKYSMILPVDYYNNVMAHHDKAGNKDKWFLKSHHVQSLTEHPLSKKDNFVASDYQIKMDNLKPQTSDYDKNVEKNIHRKQVIINQLEDRIAKLKSELSKAKRAPSVDGGRSVPTNMVENYFNKLTKSKQNKDLEEAASQGILFDLRQNQRGLLNNIRQERLNVEGLPNNKWWQKSDKTFVEDYVKNRTIIQEQFLPEDLKKHSRYIKDLESKELY